MKIAVLTMHAARNYGAVLQTYALQYVLEKKYKHSPVVMNYVSTQRKNIRFFTKVIDKYKKSWIKSLLFIISVFPTRLYSQLVFSKFVKKHLYVTKESAENNEGLKKLNYNADIFCVGSDQVWNPEHNDGVDPGFFLDFVPEGKKKIAYASSIGTEYVSEEHKSEMKKYLESFSNVSYREYSSKEIMSSIGIDATWVLDPTLLLNREDWHKMASNKKLPENYLLLYWFGNTKHVIEKAKKIAKERNLRIVRISTVLKKYEGDDIVEYFPSPERFLQLFENASFVLTDSFHGTAFSINFNKQFYSKPVHNKDARFYSLFEMFDIYDRDLLEEHKPLSEKDVDFERINRRLAEMRDISFGYLEEALKKEL